MTIGVNGISVDTGPSAPIVRTAPPVISAAGVNDPAALARQQLPTAVPAPALIAAYSANPPQVPKPPQRTANSSQPSSALAAQVIAQDSSLTSDDLAVFTPRQVPAEITTPAPAADDYLTNLRIARGDLSLAGEGAASPVSSKPTQASVQSAALDVAAHAPSAAVASSESNARSGLGQLAASLPSLFGKLLRRQTTIARTQGVDAYALAAARNAMSSVPRTPVPDL